MSTNVFDSSRLTFSFTPTNYTYIAEIDLDGEQSWSGGIVDFSQISISPASTILNYGQGIIEGLKAVQARDGRILVFRPYDHAQRFTSSAKRLLMSQLPEDLFVKAVADVVRSNSYFVPPSHHGVLYLRPLMFGSGSMLGVSSSRKFTFMIYASPVGKYLPGESKLLVEHGLHRALPNGLGSIKTAANYPITLAAMTKAKEQGCKDVLYLDARNDTYIEELSSSNFFVFLKNGSLVTPPTDSILPGITRASAIHIAREVFKYKVEERKISIQEVLEEGEEAFFSGTAAGVQSVTAIKYNGKEYPFASTEKGQQLNKYLVAIQTGEREDIFGWNFEVKPTLLEEVCHELIN